MTPPVDLVAFDLTGTTVVDAGAMAHSLEEAFRRHGIPFTDADIVSMRGAGKRAAFKVIAERALGGKATRETIGALAERTFATWRETLRDAYATGDVKPVPGAGETLRWLRERGIKVAATTALGVDLRELVLARLGWSEGVFDCKVSTDEVVRGRPAPYMIFEAMTRTGVVDVRRVAVVGDTVLDLLSGANAGAGFVVGVLTGVHGMETLGAIPHTHLLKSVAELPGIF